MLVGCGVSWWYGVVYDAALLRENGWEALRDATTILPVPDRFLTRVTVLPFKGISEVDE